MLNMSIDTAVAALAGRLQLPGRTKQADGPPPVVRSAIPVPPAPVVGGGAGVTGAIPQTTSPAWWSQIDLKNPLHAAIIGSLGLGGASLLSSMTDEEKKKHWLRNALLGAAIGGGAGYGINRLMNYAPGAAAASGLDPELPKSPFIDGTPGGLTLSQLADHDYSGAAGSAADILTQNPGHAIGGAGAGYMLGRNFDTVRRHADNLNRAMLGGPPGGSSGGGTPNPIEALWSDLQGARFRPRLRDVLNPLTAIGEPTAPLVDFGRAPAGTPGRPSMLSRTMSAIHPRNWLDAITRTTTGDYVPNRGVPGAAVNSHAVPRLALEANRPQLERIMQYGPGRGSGSGGSSGGGTEPRRYGGRLAGTALGAMLPFLSPWATYGNPPPKPDTRVFSPPPPVDPAAQPGPDF